MSEDIPNNMPITPEMGGTIVVVVVSVLRRARATLLMSVLNYPNTEYVEPPMQLSKIK